MGNIKSRILSVGTYVPDKVLTNKYFESYLDTSDEWIMTRTGIRERRIVDPDNPMTAADMGCRAALVAMEKAKVKAEEIDGVIVATFTPDNFFPSTACRIQADLECKDAFAFDISAACAGFVYALTVANNMIVSGQAKTILVVGSEVISKTLDWNDRGTCILFGDGAGAVVLQADESGRSDRGILTCHLSSDGTMGDLLILPAWGDERFLSMKGNEVFKHAVRCMADSIYKVIDKTGMKLEDMDLLIPHQANIRIIQALANQMGIPMEKVIANLDKYGNTSSASVPLALEEAWMDGRIKDGTKIVFVGVGGGFTVGSVVCVM
ncbi:MAG: ketoacyl-ACP synthase III [Chitinispirillales bacterium]|jgi:3-oxoacyl-[acyl-carrier-protein] synthase-3|nr:ketoacyl-ACP synthase III [Chitinispirillales bacterium]